MNILVTISTVDDGDIRIAPGHSGEDIAVENRIKFLKRHNISPGDTSLVKVVYEGDDYCRYRKVTPGTASSGLFDCEVAADALVTTHIGHALFLPLADCVGAAIYDPTKQVLMVSHLGRHNLEQNGAAASIQYLIESYACDPADLKIWFTPAAGIGNYPLHAFNNRSLKDVTLEQMQSAGVDTANIIDDPIDTTKDTHYYSHSEYLKGNRSHDGRFALVAVMTK